MTNVLIINILVFTDILVPVPQNISFSENDCVPFSIDDVISIFNMRSQVRTDDGQTENILISAKKPQISPQEECLDLLTIFGKISMN